MTKCFHRSLNATSTVKLSPQHILNINYDYASKHFAWAQRTKSPVELRRRRRFHLIIICQSEMRAGRCCRQEEAAKLIWIQERFSRYHKCLHIFLDTEKLFPSLVVWWKNSAQSSWQFTVPSRNGKTFSSLVLVAVQSFPTTWSLCTVS